jgi:hypothetical protein
LKREEEALENCLKSDQLYVKKMYRILGDKKFLKKNYGEAINHYFNSELSFEEIMRLLYNLYKKENQVEFAIQILKYFKILLGKFETKENGIYDLSY